MADPSLVAPDGSPLPVLPEVSPPPAPVADSLTQTTTTRLVQVPVHGQNWLASNLRSVIAIALTLVVCFMVIRGDHDAIVALMGAFTVLMGALWGERAALKVPGQDG